MKKDQTLQKAVIAGLLGPLAGASDFVDMIRELSEGKEGESQISPEHFYLASKNLKPILYDAYGKPMVGEQ